MAGKRHRMRGTGLGRPHLSTPPNRGLQEEQDGEGGRGDADQGGGDRRRGMEAEGQARLLGEEPGGGWEDHRDPEATDRERGGEAGREADDQGGDGDATDQGR
eukprot:14621380-Heterocapsa_arctica.AAC.1